MQISKKDLRDLFLILCAIFSALVNDAVYSLWQWPTYVFVTSALIFVLRNFQRHGVLGVVLLVGGLVLYVLPYFGLYMDGGNYSAIYYSLYLLVAFILIKLNPSAYCTSPFSEKKTFIWPMIAALGISFAGLFIWEPIYRAFFAIALLFFDRNCRSDSLTTRDCVLQALPFYLLQAWYFSFVWDGFGRLHFLVYLMLPVLVLLYNRRIYLKAWYMLFAAPLGVIAGTALRSSERLEAHPGTLFGGSVGHHLVLMEKINNDLSIRNWRFGELYDQYVLLFLSWYPRGAWPEKPLGIGSWFVDEYIGRRGYSESYSVSLGIWGEHIYLVPHIWVASGLLAVLLMGLLARVLYKISFKSGLVVVIFQAQSLTFFWGGMASFGSRVWWMVLPVLFYLWCEKLLFRNTKKAT